MKPAPKRLLAALVFSAVLALFLHSLRREPQTPHPEDPAPGATPAATPNATQSGTTLGTTLGTTVGTTVGTTADQNNPQPAPERPAPNPAFPAIHPPDPTRLSPIQPHPDAITFGHPNIPPEREAHLLLSFFEIYRERFGSFPTGENNAQFMNALRGNNPAALGIFPMEHPRLDEEGQLLDAWGTPFIFHKHSRDHLEIRSAGPDRSPYTPNDILVPHRPAPPPQ